MGGFVSAGRTLFYYQGYLSSGGAYLQRVGLYYRGFRRGGAPILILANIRSTKTLTMYTTDIIGQCRITISATTYIFTWYSNDLFYWMKLWRCRCRRQGGPEVWHTAHVVHLRKCVYVCVLVQGLNCMHICTIMLSIICWKSFLDVCAMITMYFSRNSRKSGNMK